MIKIERIESTGNYGVETDVPEYVEFLRSKLTEEEKEESDEYFIKVYFTQEELQEFIEYVSQTITAYM